MQERRHGPRAAVDLKCTLQLQDGGELTAKIIDLNCGGCGILTAVPLPVASHIRLGVALAGYRNAHHLNLPATVVHNFNAVVIAGGDRQTGYIVGVDFAPLPEVDETILCEYVAHALSKTVS